MAELKRIYQLEFIEELNRTYNDRYGKFSLKAKEPMRCYWDGYREIHFSEPITDFWCHIWNGPHCIYGRNELIPGVTIFTHTNSDPLFFSPKEVMEKFEFSHRNPFTGKREPDDSTYGKRLEATIAQIKSNAEA